MKIVIDIPENYLHIQSILVSQMVIDKVWDAVKEGTPLPKGHGRLIDADALIKESPCAESCLREECDNCQYKTVSIYAITNAPTIIEADKEE